MSRVREVVTFILPVLNRQQVIVRAIESCLACSSERIEPRVLVVDGGSRDDTVTRVMTTFATDHRVMLLPQPSDRPGFMNACIFAVEHLDSPLATFMYSDDLVSPSFVKLAEALAADPDVSIAFGYGQQAKEDELIVFPPVTVVERVHAERVLEAFYGRVEHLDGRSLPVSPVCCVVRSPVLKAWADHVQSFTSRRPLREHAVIRLAGGPDLMIYLSALLKGGQYALRANAVVGQLTVTAASITMSGNREAQLTVGYWLARVWGFFEADRTGRRELAAGFAGYLLAVWLFILGKKFVRLEFSWISELLGEARGIIVTLAKQKTLSMALSGLLASVWSRIRMILA
ncbi:MAG: glycosyltransferase family A protein [Nitrospirota bacterium]